MMTTMKIQFPFMHCNVCHDKFREGDRVFRMNKSDEDLCFACAKERYRKAALAGGDSDYTAYAVYQGTGELMLNPTSFEKLSEGIYEVRIGEYAAIHAVKEEEQDLDAFKKSATEDNFLLEKKKDLALLLFPRHKCMDKYDFFDCKDTYSWITDSFENVTGCKKLTLCCDADGNVIGISNLPRYKFRLYRLEASGEIEEGLTLGELEKQYMSNAVGRYVSKILERISPQELLYYCQKRIQGQGTQLKVAVYQVYRYMQEVAKGEDFRAENWILTAPSGSGKTEFYRAIRDFFKMHQVPIPVVQITIPFSVSPSATARPTACPNSG